MPAREKAKLISELANAYEDRLFGAVNLTLAAHEFGKILPL